MKAADEETGIQEPEAAVRGGLADRAQDRYLVGVTGVAHRLATQHEGEGNDD